MNRLTKLKVGDIVTVDPQWLTAGMWPRPNEPLVVTDSNPEMNMYCVSTLKTKRRIISLYKRGAFHRNWFIKNDFLSAANHALKRHKKATVK